MTPLWPQSFWTVVVCFSWVVIKCSSWGGSVLCMWVRIRERERLFFNSPVCLSTNYLFYYLFSFEQDDFDAIRPLCYPNTDIFLLCFSVVSPTSFNNIPEKWVHEIRKHSPKVPVMLVGTQSDLRNDVKVLIELAKYKEKPVSESDAIRMAHDIGAVHYMECSALTQKNLKDVFDQAILSSLNYLTDLNHSQVRKSSRKKYNLGVRHSASLKKAGWKKFCCLLWCPLLYSLNDSAQLPLPPLLDCAFWIAACTAVMIQLVKWPTKHISRFAFTGQLVTDQCMSWNSYFAWGMSSRCRSCSTFYLWRHVCKVCRWHIVYAFIDLLVCFVCSEVGIGIW